MIEKGKTFYQRRWDIRRAKIAEVKASGKVTISTYSDGRARCLRVVGPEDARFRSGAKELLGTWRARGGGYWHFDLRAKRLVVELAIKVFGPENVEVME